MLKTHQMCENLILRKRLLRVKKCLTLWSQCRAYRTFYTERLSLKASWPWPSWVLCVRFFSYQTSPHVCMRACACVCVRAVTVGSQIHRRMPSGLDRTSWDLSDATTPPSSLTTHTASHQAISPSTYPVIRVSPPTNPPTPLWSPALAICGVAIINMFLSEQSIWMSPSGSDMIKGFEKPPWLHLSPVL